MNKLNAPPTFVVPLSFEAHTTAQKLYRQQSKPHKAKQIYLNTLAVYAVNFYLQCLSIKTDLAQSHSHNPIYLKFMDVADLWVEPIGRLECRSVLPNATVCQIPAEGMSDRMGYVVVEIDESLQQAILLGFIPTAVAEIPLSELRPIGDFPEYLNQIQQASQSPSQNLTHLGQWFEHLFEPGWQELAALLSPEESALDLSMRSYDEPLIQRGKLIWFATQNQLMVILVIKLIPKSETRINVLLEMRPIIGQRYLPEGLQVKVLDAQGTVVMQAIASDTNQNIQFDFDTNCGESFSVKMILEEVCTVENFVV